MRRKPGPPPAARSQLRPDRMAAYPGWRDPAPVPLADGDFAPHDQVQPLGFDVDNGTVNVLFAWKLDLFAVAALLYDSTEGITDRSAVQGVLRCATLPQLLQWLIPELLRPSMEAAQITEAAVHDEVSNPETEPLLLRWFAQCAEQAAALTAVSDLDTQVAS